MAINPLDGAKAPVTPNAKKSSNPKPADAKKPEAAAEDKKERKVANPNYPDLSQAFMSSRSTFSGRLKSVYKDRDDKPQKLEQFKKGLAAGDFKFDKPLTHQELAKCKELGINVPAEFLPVSKSVAEAAADKATNA